MKSLIRSSNFPMLLLLTAAFFIGVWSYSDFGVSWDEPDIYKYGKYALNAYSYFLHPQDLPEFSSNLNNYGPAYFMLGTLFARGFDDPRQAWHLFYFITFLAGDFVLYLFSKRYMDHWAAFGVALLFLAQPLLWGHAFINPKDMAFLVFFMASIFLGFQMSDEERPLPRRVLIFAAGILLGLTVSIRAIGPLAGMFVLIHAFIKHKRGAFVYLIPYLLIAVIAAYITWPYLWKSPVTKYIESLRLMSHFPFSEKILFWGKLYPTDQMPRSYFPTLFALQLTEPALLLILPGILVMLISRKIEVMLLFVGWFMFPASAILLGRSELYDNARQLFFILPPLFLIAGLALDYVFVRMKNPYLKSAVLLLAILPGIFSIVRLHPYQYVYYNSLIGGVGGAYHQQETDYWGTSFKEAMEYVNEAATPNSRVLVLSGPATVALSYARPDIQVNTEENDPTPQKGYDYALILTRRNLSERRCKKAEVVHSVGREGAIFTLVMKLDATRDCK
jgi:hypothetical protein